MPVKLKEGGGVMGAISKTASYVTDGAVGIVQNLPIIAPAAIYLLSKTGSLGDKTGVNAFKKAGDAGNNLKKISEKTVGDFVPLNGKTGRAFQGFADKASKNVNKAANALGLSYIADNVNDARGNRLLNKLYLLEDELTRSNLPRGVVLKAKEVIKSVKHLDSTKNIDNEKVSKALSSFTNSISNAKDLARKDSKLASKIARTAEKVSISRTNASYIRKPGNFLKNFSGALGKTKVLPGILNVTFIVSSIAGLFGVVSNLVKNVSALKVMSKDLTGKETSTMDVVLGKVDNPIIKDARSKLVKTSVVSGATDTLSLGLNVANAVKGGLSLVGFMGPQIAGNVVNGIIGDSALPAYTAINQMHSSGEKVPAEVYAALIGAASPEIKARGGADSKFAQELGKIYAAENASASQIMREISNGKMLEHVKTLIAANEAAKPATATAIATGSHVAALQKKPTSEQKIVGPHTDQLAKMVESAKQASALGV